MKTLLIVCVILGLATMFQAYSTLQQLDDLNDQFQEEQAQQDLQDYKDCMPSSTAPKPALDN
jgi:hypothetical protein